MHYFLGKLTQWAISSQHGQNLFEFKGDFRNFLDDVKFEIFTETKASFSSEFLKLNRQVKKHNHGDLYV